MRTVECRDCHRPTPKRLLRAPRCQDRERCTSLAAAMSTEPPEPLEFEQPPKDIGVCSQCRGWGEYPVGQDWETGALNLERCGRCDGTGSEPGW